MPPVIFETPGAFGSLKAWEQYRARLEAHSGEGSSNPAMEAADRWIAHLKAKEGSSTKRTPDKDGREEE